MELKHVGRIVITVGRWVCPLCGYRATSEELERMGFLPICECGEDLQKHNY